MAITTRNLYMIYYRNWHGQLTLFKLPREGKNIAFGFEYEADAITLLHCISEIWRSIYRLEPINIQDCDPVIVYGEITGRDAYEFAEEIMQNACQAGSISSYVQSAAVSSFKART